MVREERSPDAVLYWQHHPNVVPLVRLVTSGLVYARRWADASIAGVDENRLALWVWRTAPAKYRPGGSADPNQLRFIQFMNGANWESLVHKETLLPLPSTLVNHFV